MSNRGATIWAMFCFTIKTRKKTECRQMHKDPRTLHYDTPRAALPTALLGKLERIFHLFAGLEVLSIEEARPNPLSVYL
jgi:hypothetical protein